MFGKTAFIVKTILFLGLATVTLVESGREKKDVHHMIFLNDSKRPPHRHKNQEHPDYHNENRPKKSKKRPGEKKNKEPTVFENSVEENSYEEFLRHKPKSQRHQNKNTRRPVRNHKRHNNQRPHNDHKKHHKNDQHHHNHDKHKEPHQFSTSNWIPLSSNDLLGTGQHQFLGGSGLGHQGQGYIQPIPMEITTPSPLQPSSHQFQSTIFPPLPASYHHYLNQKGENSPLPPLIGTVEPYKPFDYSILEQKPQNLNPTGTYQGQEISSSNVVNVKHVEGKDGKPFSIIVENSGEDSENKGKKEEEKEKKSEEDGGRNEKAKGKGKRTRGGSRYRKRTKN